VDRVRKLIKANADIMEVIERDLKITDQQSVDIDRKIYNILKDLVINMQKRRKLETV